MRAKRTFWLLVIAIVLGGWLVRKLCSTPDEPIFGSPTTPTTPTVESLEEYRFGFRRPVMQNPSVDHVRRERADLIERANRMRIVPSDALPMTNTVIWERIRRAQEIIATAHVPTGFWEWDAVKQTVLAIGTRYPIVQAPSSTDTRRQQSMAYVSFLQTFKLWPETVLQLSVEDLTEILLHEATHAVYAQQFAGVSGFSARQEQYLLANCSDVRVVMGMLSEGLAWRNEALWRVERQGDIAMPAHPYADHILRAALDSYRDPTHANGRYGRALYSYMDNQELQYGSRARGGGRACLPLVSMREIAWFSPADVFPTFALPLYQAAQRE